MGAQHGVATDSLKFHPGSRSPTLLRPAGRPSLKELYSHFRGGLPTGWAAYGYLLPLWTAHAVCLWLYIKKKVSLKDVSQLENDI
jgi:hypothetical protein